MLYIITKLVDIKNTKKFHDYNLKNFLQSNSPFLDLLLLLQVFKLIRTLNIT